MKDTFPIALEHVLKYEGGYSYHPRDPGGATNYGITHKTLARFRGTKISKADVRQLTLKEAGQIYTLYYWTPVLCDRLPAGLDLAVFDCAVNQGPGKAVLVLQKAAQTRADGIIGPATMAAIRRSDPASLLDEFIARRMWRYGLLKRLFPTFGLGWSRRLIATHCAALVLMQENA